MTEIKEVHDECSSLSSVDVTAEILLECSGEAIYAIDRDGVCIFANPVAIDILGYKDASEVVGINMYSHMLARSGVEKAALDQSAVYKALLSGQECHVDTEFFLRKDGSCFPVAYSVYPLSKNNVILGSVITFSDITERKEIEAALMRSEEVLSKAQEIAHIGSWDWDISTNELRWSDEIYRIFGLTPQEFGATYDAFLTRIESSDRQAVIDAVNQAVADVNAQYSIEHKVIRPDGVIRVVHEHGKVYRNANNEAIRMIGTVHDITERKLAEDKIRQLNEELELRVSQRTQELQVANSELNRSLTNLRLLQDQLVESAKMASLGGLVAGVAHEINTPLGIGVTVASLMNDKVAGLLKKYEEDALTREDFEEFIKVVRESSPLLIHNLKRAANLIKSFKLVAVDSSHDEKRLFNVKDYFETVLQSLQPKLAKFNVEVLLTCDKSLVFYADPGGFSQIVTNLVMNSLLHGFEGRNKGSINLSVTHNNEDDVVIVYTDDGVGMASETAERIFEPFFTTKRGQGGTGLGMHITYNLICQSMGGRVTCSSELGSGVRFDILLPSTLVSKERFLTQSQSALTL